MLHSAVSTTAHSSSPQLVAVSSSWWTAWRAFASSSPSAPWPGPVQVEPPPHTFLPSAIFDKLVEMNGPNPDGLDPKRATALVPPHWKAVRWSTPEDACACCASPKPKWQCHKQLRYCSEQCHTSHLDYHVCTPASSSSEEEEGPPPPPPPRLLAVGLNNLGNSCFLNAPVQCLIHTKPLTRYFLRNSYLADMGPKSSPLPRVWAELCRQLVFGSQHSVSPLELKRLAMTKAQFSGYDQQDGQELLTFILETLHADLDLVKPPKPANATWKSEPENADEAWVRERLRERSIVWHLFEGLQTSTVECSACHAQSRNYSEFRELPLTFDAKDKQLRVTLVRHAPPHLRHLPPLVLNRNYLLAASPRSSILVLKQLLSQHSKVPVERIFLCLLTPSRLANELRNSDGVWEIDDADELVAYELASACSRHLLVYNLHRERLRGLPLMLAVPPDWSGRDCVADAWQRLRSVARLRPPMASVPGALVLPIRVPKLGALAGLPRPHNDLADGVHMALCHWDEVVHVDFDLDQTAEKTSHPSAEAFAPDQGPRDSLRQMMRSFCRPEKLDEYKCERCENRGEAVKRLVLERMPEVLIIFLKRFEGFGAHFGGGGGYHSEKISNFVDFELEGADFSDFSGCKDDVYDCFGVCNHYGMIHGGHYTAFCCLDVGDDTPGQTWVELDDGVCSPVKKSQVVSSAAYMIFFRKRRSPQVL